MTPFYMSTHNTVCYVTKPDVENRPRDKFEKFLKK